MKITRPVKTVTIENAWRRENKRRFKKYNRFTRDLVLNSQRDNDGSVVGNAANSFSLTDVQLASMMKLLRQRAYQDIIGVNSINNANSSVEVDQTDEWQGRYIKASYLKGYKVTEQQLKSDGIGVQLSLAELQDLYQVGTDEGAARLLSSTNKLHGETVSSIQEKSLTELVAVTEKMIAQIKGKMLDANNNTPTSNLIADLSDRISVANTAGEQIGSTETVQSFQKAQINTATIREEQTGETIKVRWLTRDDSRVRDLHARWHGVVMTRDEAQANINVSPWNCRCGFAVESERAYENEKRNAMFDKERAELIGEE